MAHEDLIHLVEVTAYDPASAAITVLRFASGLGKMTLASETPANAHFSPRVVQPASFSRTMFSNARISGGTTVGIGEIVLNNADQALAGLRDLGIDGRDVIIRVGPQGAAYPTGYTTFLVGTAEQVEVGARTATIRLRDRLHLLQQPLQSTLYAGSNVLPSGAEGTADDIKGSRKPLLFGRRFQIEPVLVNTARLIFQVHDGPIHAIDAVYDMGAALAAGADYATLAAIEAASAAAGTYVTCLALGLFRLGAAPAGKVTLDARGDATGGYASTAGAIVQRILTGRCGFAVGDLDSPSFTALNAAAPAECGSYVTGEVTRQAALDTILASCGGWLAPTRTGIWKVGQLVAPTGPPVMTFTDVHILKLDSLATRDTGAGVPVWRVKLRYRPHAALGRTDLAGTLSEARKAELQQPWREVAASDSTVQTAHLLAPELLRETALAHAVDAASEAARLLDLHKQRRDYVQAEVWLTQVHAVIDLGAIVRLVTPRLGYSAGRNFVVVGITVNARRTRLTLDLWG